MLLNDGVDGWHGHGGALAGVNRALLAAGCTKRSCLVLGSGRFASGTVGGTVGGIECGTVCETGCGTVDCGRGALWFQSCTSLNASPLVVH